MLIKSQYPNKRVNLEGDAERKIKQDLDLLENLKKQFACKSIFGQDALVRPFAKTGVPCKGCSQGSGKGDLLI